MSVCDNVPEEDKGVTSGAEIESEPIERRIFSSIVACDGWGGAESLEGEAPIVFEAVCDGGWERSGMLSPRPLVKCERLFEMGSTLGEIHVMADDRAGGGQSESQSAGSTQQWKVNSNLSFG